MKGGAMKYQVSTDDNFHYMDETERIDGNGYDTYEEAVEEAKRIVDNSLRWERLQSEDPNDPELLSKLMIPAEANRIALEAQVPDHSRMLEISEVESNSMVFILS